MSRFLLGAFQVPRFSSSWAQEISKICLLLGTRNIQDELSLGHKKKSRILSVTFAFSIDKWGPHAPSVLVCLRFGCP